MEPRQVKQLQDDRLHHRQELAAADTQLGDMRLSNSRLEQVAADSKREGADMARKMAGKQARKQEQLRSFWGEHDAARVEELDQLRSTKVPPLPLAA